MKSQSVLLLFNLGLALTRIPINVGGFFPMNNRVWDGSGILPAVQMAFEYINKDNALLPGYELKLFWNDSEVSYYFFNSYKQIYIISHVLIGLIRISET